MIITFFSHAHFVVTRRVSSPSAVQPDSMHLRTQIRQTLRDSHSVNSIQKSSASCCVRRVQVNDVHHSEPPKNQPADATQPLPTQSAPHLVNRRLVFSIPSMVFVVERAEAALAAGASSQDLEKQLPGLPSPAPELPKAYQRTMHKLVKALRQSIEAEAAGAKEFEVRRKADGAKDLVKEFVGKWQDNRDVVGDVTHSEMKDALSELGRFYQSKGPRARLNSTTRDSILAHLAAVQAALPEEEKSLLGF